MCDGDLYSFFQCMLCWLHRTVQTFVLASKGGQSRFDFIDLRLELAVLLLYLVRDIELTFLVYQLNASFK